MAGINLYYQKPPLGYKYIPGDRYIFRALRSLLKGKKVSGLDKVFINLCKGLDELGVEYWVNRTYSEIKPGEPVVALGLEKFSLKGYNRPNAIIAGIGLMTHPSEWPALLQEYPVAKYLQHSKWAMDIYVPYFGKEHCDLWPSGIDTNHWAPGENAEKKIDFLVYTKFLFDREETTTALRNPVLAKLGELRFSYKEIVYGQYNETEYRNLLNECNAMLFLCEHESQGFACCEALAMDVPVFAWDQGFWLDPNRFKWNDPVVPATSVPFFDNRCGMKFKDFEAFEQTITTFYENVKAGDFNPRAYILQNLTLRKSAERMLELINSVYK